jgi:5-methylcytosine-specific restriction endonuclease McrA
VSTSDNHLLRKPCNCGSMEGTIRIKGGQDCVYCFHCSRWQYNAPKVETGREVRSVSTTHEAIKPNQRARVIERANTRCERCGKRASECKTSLHVGHILSVDDGHKYGLSDDVINSDENLIAECDECNLGHGKGVLPVRLLVALLATRAASAKLA